MTTAVLSKFADGIPAELNVLVPQVTVLNFLYSAFVAVL